MFGSNTVTLTVNIKYKDSRIPNAVEKITIKDISDNTTGDQIKRQIETREGIPVSQQSLYFGQSALQNNQKVAKLWITEFSTPFNQANVSQFALSLESGETEEEYFQRKKLNPGLVQGKRLGSKPD